MPIFEKPSGFLSYELSGQGDNYVTLIHGWTCDSLDWEKQVPWFSGRCSVLTIDLRGHGLSSKARTTLNPKALAEDCISVIEHLNIRSSALIAHSLGGAVAAIMAVERPDLFSSLLTIEPAYGVDSTGASAALRLLADMDKADEETSRALLKTFFSRLDPDTVDEPLRRWHMSRAEKIDLAVAYQCLKDLWLSDNQISMEPSTTIYLARLRVPVMELYADERQSFWDWSQSSLHAACKRRIRWTGVGHWPHQQEPQDFNELAFNWVSNWYK